jgi:hypothetical protein
VSCTLSAGACVLISGHAADQVAATPHASGNREGRGTQARGEPGASCGETQRLIRLRQRRGARKAKWLGFGCTQVESTVVWSHVVRNDAHRRRPSCLCCACACRACKVYFGTVTEVCGLIETVFGGASRQRTPQPLTRNTRGVGLLFPPDLCPAHAAPQGTQEAPLFPSGPLCCSRK